jgi:hypothetical protein
VLIQAYKLKGRIDDSGQLIIDDPIPLPPGDVEVVIMWPSESKDTDRHPETFQLEP